MKMLSDRFTRNVFILEFGRKDTVWLKHWYSFYIQWKISYILDFSKSKAQIYWKSSNWPRSHLSLFHLKLLIKFLKYILSWEGQTPSSPSQEDVSSALLKNLRSFITLMRSSITANIQQQSFLPERKEKSESQGSNHYM